MKIVDIEVKSDNLLTVLNASKEQMQKGLKAIAVKAESYAKDDCPVDTGRLKNSISNAVKDNAAYIGTNVEYAPYVEFNTNVVHRTGRAHFLRDAASTHGDEYKEIMKAALKS